MKNNSCNIQIYCTESKNTDKCQVEKTSGMFPNQIANNDSFP